MEAGATIDLTVNGAAREASRDSTVGSLLTSLGIEPRMVVVEVNRTILRDREAYASLSLHDGDIVEIVHFVGGG
ncbi:MAG: sulfur carrier protein ThiS [Gemmatimonadaceae bacterium]|nr:sulfur carrier protein ThiS [Gemmatimonadaceae bacterium]